jgi:predicted ATP-grasp superfamily ATP-dependent carboligase
MKKLKTKYSIFYIGMDFYQGLPGNYIFDDFHIITHRYNRHIDKLNETADIFCLEEKTSNIPKNTGHLLANKLVQEYIAKKANKPPLIIFFKPSLKIDLLGKKLGYKLAGNPSQTAKRLENKILFTKIIKKHNLALIPKCKIYNKPYSPKLIESSFSYPLILQYETGWAGKSSHIINNKSELEEKISKSSSPIKISQMLSGITLTNNCVITNDNKVISSSPALQITGNPLLTRQKLSTCGRSWDGKINGKAVGKINKITEKIGNYLISLNYKGFFGLDFQLSEGNVYLLEINPRLTASYPFYTFLELSENLMPLFAYHVASFIGLDLPTYKQGKIQGSEIIQRNKENKTVTIKSTLESGEYYNQKKVGDSILPNMNFTLIAPSENEKINENQEMFKISSKKILTSIEDGHVDIKDEAKEILSFFKKNIHNE